MVKSVPNNNHVFRSISTFCAIILVGGVLLWDLCAMIYSPKDTVSDVIMVWNNHSGGLLALIFLAMWVHWFLPLPKCWTTNLKCE